MRSTLRPSLLLFPLVSAACVGSGDGDALDVHVNPNDNVSVVVSFKQSNATLARVVSSDGVHTVATPYFPVGPKGYGEIAVLGLAPSTSYDHVLEMLTASGVVSSAHVSAATAALPDGLAPFSVVVTNGTGAPEANGYWLVSGGSPFTFAFDASGLVRWYRAFDVTTAEAKMQRDGTFTTFVGTSTGDQIVPGAYVRYDAAGQEVGRIVAAPIDPTENGAAVTTDPHELLVTIDADGAEHHHLFGYVQRPFSDDDSTLASWHELLRQSADGSVEFRWKSWSRFDADDRDPSVTESDVDIDHANALAIDPTDGNYVASFRSFSALVKIDAQSGDVLWQLGGKRNDFTFVGDPLFGFQGAHSVQILPNGDVLLYDNGQGHVPQESRAVEYKLDTQAKTATMVWEFRHSPALFTTVTGSVQHLGNGNRLVAFAYAGVVDEVDRAGHVVWEATITQAGAPAKLYRVRRLPSFYSYVAP